MTQCILGTSLMPALSAYYFSAVFHRLPSVTPSNSTTGFPCSRASSSANVKAAELSMLTPPALFRKTSITTTSTTTTTRKSSTCQPRQPSKWMSSNPCCFISTSLSLHCSTSLKHLIAPSKEAHNHNDVIATHLIQLLEISDLDNASLLSKMLWRIEHGLHCRQQHVLNLWDMSTMKCVLVFLCILGTAPPSLLPSQPNNSKTYNPVV